MILVVSTNLWSQVITKPENSKFSIYYMDDKSISISSKDLRFPSTDIPKLMDIFTKADKLDMYCRTHVNIDVEKIIDSVGVYKFTYKFNPLRKLSAIAIYQNEPCNTYIYNFNKMSFVDYLGKFRDDYYVRLKTYNDEVNRVEVTLNAIMN